MAVIQQYAKPLKPRPRNLRSFLGALCDNTIYCGMVYRHGRKIDLTIEGEGQPKVDIGIGEWTNVHGRRWLLFNIEGVRQCLGTSISKESEVSWNILAGDQWDEFMRGHLYNLDKPQNPLEAAQKWRGVMDDVLKVRPIHRAALP